MRSLSWMSWAVFATGIAAIVALQVIAVSIVYTNWGWNRSNFAKHFFWPLLGLAFLVCAAAPLLSTGSLLRRFVACGLAGLSAALVYFASSFIILILYGA
jgi:hypothetical protein